MHTRTLGREGLTVSAIGLGRWGMSQVYGPADDSVATLERALDLGVTLLDTSMSYGRGHNERLLTRVLATRRDGGDRVRLRPRRRQPRFGAHADRPVTPASPQRVGGDWVPWADMPARGADLASPRAMPTDEHRGQQAMNAGSMR
jgi:hypothetical protein